MAGAGHDPVVVEDERCQPATDRTLRQRGGRPRHAVADGAERDPCRIAVLRPDDRVEPEGFAGIPEPQVELGRVFRQPAAGHRPAARRLVHLEPGGQLGHGRRREISTPAGQRRKRARVDAEDVDPTPGLGRAALAEHRDRGHVRAECGVAIDRDDRRRDRQPGPEFGDPQVEP